MAEINKLMIPRPSVDRYYDDKNDDNVCTVLVQRIVVYSQPRVVSPVQSVNIFCASCELRISNLHWFSRYRGRLTSISESVYIIARVR